MNFHKLKIKTEKKNQRTSFILFSPFFPFFFLFSWLLLPMLHCRCHILCVFWTVTTSKKAKEKKHSTTQAACWHTSGVASSVCPALRSEVLPSAPASPEEEPPELEQAKKRKATAKKIVRKTQAPCARREKEKKRHWDVKSIKDTPKKVFFSRTIVQSWQGCEKLRKTHGSHVNHTCASMTATPRPAMRSHCHARSRKRKNVVLQACQSSGQPQTLGWFLQLVGDDDDLLVLLALILTSVLPRDVAQFDLTEAFLCVPIVHDFAGYESVKVWRCLDCPKWTCTCSCITFAATLSTSWQFRG